MKLQDMLRLHCCPAGTVWCGQNRTTAQDSGLSVDEFVTRPAFSEAAGIAIVGCRQNAELVHKTFFRRIQIGKPGTTFVSGPRAAGSDIVSPERVLHQVLHPDPTYQQIWRAIDTASQISFQLAYFWEQNRTQSMLSLLPGHPAWPAVQFAEGCDRVATAALFAEILDPRWYNHPRKPNRLTCLYSYLGLVPDVQAGFGNSPAQSRFDLVEAAIAGAANLPAFRTEGGVTPRLQVLRRFVMLLALSWKQGMAQPGRHIFDTGRFFRDEETERQYLAMSA